MPSRRAHLAAVLETAVSAVLFGVMAFLTKRATRQVDGAQVACVRSAVGLGLALAVLLRRGGLRPRRPDLVLLRGVLGGLALLLYFLAIGALPVGTATLLQYSSPIFTTLFAALVLGERPPLAHVAALGVTVAGVGLVVLGQGAVLGGAYLWLGVALGSAVLTGGAVTAIRAARRHDGPWTVFAAFCLCSTIIAAVVAVPRWRTPDRATWGLLLAIGVLAAVAQVMMTHALGVVAAATSGIVAQLTVVVALGLGLLVDREPLAPLAAVGAVLTVAGLVVVSRETPS
jgi:drug/metabolite transporter (DMT)-like permease